VGAVRDPRTRPRRRLSELFANARASKWRGGWTLVERAASPEELVLRQPDAGGERLASLCHPSAAAVVLGSTQRPSEINDGERRRRGYELVTRRSGGGAVVVAPRAQVWLDVFVPRADSLFEDDVGRAASWVSELWLTAIAASAHPSEPIEPIREFTPTRFSRAVCFSGLGPGEVTIAGRKVVGVSQRRGREGAWFFTMALLENLQGALSELLDLEQHDREVLAFELATRVGVAVVGSTALEAAISSLLRGGS
jgi:lipoate---protein ligase